MSDNVVKISDYQHPWKEVFTSDCQSSTLQIYVNERTGECEIVQMNDDGDAIRTQLSDSDRNFLVEALTRTP